MEIGRKTLGFASSQEGKTDWESNLGESKHERWSLHCLGGEKGIRAKQNSYHKEGGLLWLTNIKIKRKHKISKKPKPDHCEQVQKNSTNIQNNTKKKR